MTIIHLVIILSAFLITFFRILGKDYFWVIDDLDGVASYSDKWNEKEQKVIDTREINGKQLKSLSFMKELGFPGSILKWFRLNFGNTYKVIGKNSKGHDVWGNVQSPVKHHILSMLVQALNLILGYYFLTPLIGADLAFASCLLFSVHPLTTQTVVWISGINYSLSLLFSLVMFNIVLYCKIPELLLPLVLASSVISTFTLYVGGLSWVILLFLGYKIPALVAGVVGLGIIYFKGRETKALRIEEFKKQNMVGSTFFNIRKPIVMMKTLWYYMRLVFLPLRMGLYHVWGYFYEEPIERIDKMFWLGVLTLTTFVVGFYYGSVAIKLGIIWYLTYFIIFSNLITAQQFVTDRYVTIPAFGICMILASLLYGTPFFGVLLGCYIMRTYVHLPTFKNEVDFYSSNFVNFRKSEVSLGNLGVAFINQGMAGAAIDTWSLATKINPHYDVPWYNLYSVFKGNGRFEEARDFLKRCLDAKVVHFDKKWKEEFDQIEKIISIQKTTNPNGVDQYNKAAEHYSKKETDLELQCLRNFMAGDTSGLIPEMISQVKARLAELESSNPVQLYNPVQEPKRPEASGLDPIDPVTGVPSIPN